jgi:peptidyl-prolyl cis-trans isomerase D
LSESAKAAGLEVKMIDAIDFNGLDKDGKPAIDNVEPVALLKAVFASDVGVDNDTILTRDGGYIWFEVQKIEQARDRTLDEVKDKVSAAWKNDEIAKKLSTIAADAVKKLNSGISMNDISLELGSLTIKTAKGIQRAGKSELPANFLAQVFNQPVDGAGSVALVTGERALFKVTGSTVPPLDKNSDNVKQISARLKSSLADDMLSEYLAKLQADAGVRINEQAYSQIIGQN